MAVAKLTMCDLVETHKPKKVKYKYIITDDKVYDELIDANYDIDTLDTINNDALVREAMLSNFASVFGREVIGKAKSPTILENGVVFSKSLITKADKKLMSINMSEFMFSGIKHVAIKFNYEFFSILEIFILS